MAFKVSTCADILTLAKWKEIYRTATLEEASPTNNNYRLIQLY